MPIINLHQTPGYLVSPYWQMDGYYNEQIGTTYSHFDKYGNGIGHQIPLYGWVKYISNMYSKPADTMISCFDTGTRVSDIDAGRFNAKGYKLIFTWRDTNTGTTWKNRGIKSLIFRIHYYFDFYKYTNLDEVDYAAADGTKNLPAGVSISMVKRIGDGDAKTRPLYYVGDIGDGYRYIYVTVSFT